MYRKLTLVVVAVCMLVSLMGSSALAGVEMVNGDIPESAQYVPSLDMVTPIYADLKELAAEVQQKLGRKPNVLISSVHITNDWNRKVLEGAVEAAKELGANITTTNAQGDWNQQVSDIENAIAKKVDAIVVCGGYGKTLQEALRKAQAAGIPVATVDIPSPYVVTNATSDNFSGAAMLAMKMCMDIGGEGNIVVLYSPGWHTLDIRRWMLDEILKDFPDVKIISEQPVDEEDAINSTLKTMESVLQAHPKGTIDAVYAVFGLPGVGAAKAIEKAGRTEIGVYAVDADMIVLQAILKEGGAFRACIGQSTVHLGRTATVAAFLDLVGKSEGIQAQTFCPITLVTKENADAVGKFLYGNEWR